MSGPLEVAIAIAKDQSSGAIYQIVPRVMSEFTVVMKASYKKPVIELASLAEGSEYCSILFNNVGTMRLPQKAALEPDSGPGKESGRYVNFIP